MQLATLHLSGGDDPSQSDRGDVMFPGSGMRSDLRGERAMDLCECMIDIAAALFNVSGRELRRAGRTPLAVTRVRQVAMYVSHVVLGLSMTDVGRGFGRDRTTVLYACHLIEDLRDDAEFDRIVTTTERIATIAIRGRRAG